MPTYLQLVHQIKHAVQYAMLKPGDRLPTAREVVEDLAINPSTVLKAYRELEREGFVYSRPGAGTFVAHDAPAPLARTVHQPLRRSLDRLLASALAVGLAGYWEVASGGNHDKYPASAPTVFASTATSPVTPGRTPSRSTARRPPTG